MICRLHLRHFNSTPSGSKRASRLPQQHRSDRVPFFGRAGLSSFCSVPERIGSSNFLSFTRHDESGRDEREQHEGLRGDGFERRVYP